MSKIISKYNSLKNASLNKCRGEEKLDDDDDSKDNYEQKPASKPDALKPADSCNKFGNKEINVFIGHLINMEEDLEALPKSLYTVIAPL